MYLTDYTKNYAKFKDKTYRILYKDIDNSLILYTDDDNGFGNDFDNITQSFPQNDPKALQCDSLSNCNTIKATSPLSATNLVFYDKNGKTTSYNDEPYLYTGFSYNFDRPTDCTGKINNDEMGILWGKTNVKGEYNLYKPNISYDLSKLILLKYGYKDLSSGYIDSYRYAKLIFRKKLDVVNKEQYMTFDIISKLNEVEYPDFIKYQEVLSINAYYFSSLKIGGTTYDKAGVYSCEGGQNNNAKSGNVMIKGRKINLKPCVIIESGTGGENNPFILSSNSC